MIDATQYGQKVQLNFSAQGLSQTITLDVDTADMLVDQLTHVIDAIEWDDGTDRELERAWRE
jgi:hypothetical protein